jgi:hypothetical protein
MGLDMGKQCVQAVQVNPLPGEVGYIWWQLAWDRRLSRRYGPASCRGAKRRIACQDLLVQLLRRRRRFDA